MSRGASLHYLPIFPISTLPVCVLGQYFPVVSARPAAGVGWAGRCGSVLLTATKWFTSKGKRYEETFLGQPRGPRVDGTPEQPDFRRQLLSAGLSTCLFGSGHLHGRADGACAADDDGDSKSHRDRMSPRNADAKSHRLPNGRSQRRRSIRVHRVEATSPNPPRDLPSLGARMERRHDRVHRDGPARREASRCSQGFEVRPVDRKAHRL